MVIKGFFKNKQKGKSRAPKMLKKTISTLLMQMKKIYFSAVFLDPLGKDFQSKICNNLFELVLVWGAHIVGKSGEGNLQIA